MGREVVGWEAIAGCILGGLGHSLAIAIGNPLSAYGTARQCLELRASIRAVKDRMFGYNQAANQSLAIDRARFYTEERGGLGQVARETEKCHLISLFISIAGGSLIGYYKKGLLMSFGWGTVFTILESGVRAYRAILHQRAIHV